MCLAPAICRGHRFRVAPARPFRYNRHSEQFCALAEASHAAARSIMILIEPAIQARFGRSLRRRALAAFLAQSAESLNLKGEVSVLLTTDREIRRLNRTFRRSDKPTDVLSFPAPASLPGRPALGGDLAVSVETAQRQAADAGHPLFVELEVLLLHGVLHLAGYDHETDAGQMARKEAALRRQFGLGAGLIERAAGEPRPRSRATLPDRRRPS
jgi:probable rRNA maturation factor